MNRFIYVALALGVALTPLYKAEAALPAGFEVETLAGGMTLPTAMAFTNDGRVFIAEKGGSVRVWKNGALLSTPLIQLTDVNSYADHGLIGITVDPNFSTNGYVYLLYTYENTPGTNFAGPKTGRLVRVTAVGDTADESTKVVLLGTVGGTLATPSCENFAVTVDCIPSDSPSHSVGGLRFGPDGKLYVSLGDGSHFEYVDPRAMRSQNIDSLAGKILRINPDGTAPADNPFYNGSPTANRSKVFAYGFRNAYRFNFRPSNNALYVGDVGWSTWEEVNKVVAGGNYGWPCREGNAVTNGYGCDVNPHVDPIYTYAHDVNGAGSIAAGAFATAYPAPYINSFFIGDYAQNWIKRVTVNAADGFVSVDNFMLGSDGANGPVAIDRGPDGNIYYLAIYTGELKRFLYTTGNRQPNAVLGATPSNGLAPLTVNFSAAGSSDPDGNPLTYSWVFGDGAVSTSAAPAHTYSANGTYTAVLAVFDGQGGQNTKSQTITVGNRAPTAIITAPENGSLYRIGDTISLSGLGTDPEDGNITTAGQLSWTIILHHNIHTHTIQTLSGTNPSFPAPDHESATDIFTEVQLKVTDAGGLSNTKSINLYLNNNPVSSGNLIQNPSLEDPAPGTATSPEFWSQGGYGINNTVYTYPVIGFDGADAAKVSMTSYTTGDAKWSHNPVSITPNTSYTFSGYFTGSDNAGVTAQYGFSNGTYTYEDLGDAVPGTGWTRIDRNFTTPAGAQTAAIFVTLNDVGEITIDNFSLTTGSVTPPPPPPPPPPPTNPNLVLNPSVETAGVPATLPQDWFTGKWGTNTTTFTYPATGFDGTKAMRVQTTAYTSGDAKWFFKDVPVTALTQYNFSNYYQSNATTSLTLRYTSTGGAVSYVSLAANVAPSATWKQLNYTFTPPAGTASVTVFHILAKVGTLTTDLYNISLPGGTTPPPPPPPPPVGDNLINNGSFEAGTTGNPTGWAKGGWGTHTTAYNYPVVGRDGNKAAEINITAYSSGDVKWYPASVPMQAGKEYTFSAWYKSNTISDVIGQYQLTDGSLHYFGVIKELQPVSDWTFFTAKFTPPANAVNFIPMHLISSIGYLTTDDVSLVVTGSATSTNDITAPIVDIISPLHNTTVSGTITVTASSTDNIAVTGVMFAVDGTPVTPLVQSPYNFVWDTTTVPNGTHILKATTHDAAGNNSASSTTVIVNNSATPPATNLISNPSLESTDGVGNPQNWAKGSWGTNVIEFVFPVAGSEGTKAAQVKMTSRSSGDAKWYFDPVAVTAGGTYTYSNYYKSTVGTTLTARYTMSNGSFSYVELGTVPAAAAWTKYEKQIVMPANAVAVTVFHLIQAVGELSVDQFSLSL